MKKGFTIFLIPEESGLPSMQFRISFASMISGATAVLILLLVVMLMVFDLNTAADDNNMHSENLRIRNELDSMYLETRELQRQIELLQAYSLHIDISTNDSNNSVETTKSTSKPTSKELQNINKKQKYQKNIKQQPTDIPPKSNSKIYIDVKPETNPKDTMKTDIFIDVSSEENPPKKK